MHLARWLAFSVGHTSGTPLDHFAMSASSSPRASAAGDKRTDCDFLSEAGMRAALIETNKNYRELAVRMQVLADRMLAMENLVSSHNLTITAARLAEERYQASRASGPLPLEDRFVTLRTLRTLLDEAKAEYPTKQQVLEWFATENGDGEESEEMTQ